MLMHEAKEIDAKELKVREGGCESRNRKKIQAIRVLSDHRIFQNKIIK